MESQWNHKIFTVNEQGFEQLALEIFRFQYRNNPVYQEYVNALHINVSAVRSVSGIPFLPIRFFKSHAVRTSISDTGTIFESSGTTGSINSKHHVIDVNIYKESFINTFELFYGPVEEWCIIGLLPSYLERENSSLIYMINELIKMSSHSESGFYLHEYDKLFSVLQSMEKRKQKTILIGVTFALIGLAEKYSSSFEHIIIMETGGMKGKRQEMIRREVHDMLQQSFHVPAVHSEYGMTELLSQAYSKGNGIFYCPPWMKVLVRDDEDPLSVQMSSANQRMACVTGAINIVDLANIYSCSFIATDDAGKLYHDGSFEVLGRMDNSDLRGCSLMTI